MRWIHSRHSIYYEIKIFEIQWRILLCLSLTPKMLTKKCFFVKHNQDRKVIWTLVVVNGIMILINRFRNVSQCNCILYVCSVQCVKCICVRSNKRVEHVKDIYEPWQIMNFNEKSVYYILSFKYWIKYIQ